MYPKSLKVPGVGRPKRALRLIWGVGEGGSMVGKVFGLKGCLFVVFCNRVKLNGNVRYVSFVRAGPSL